MSIVNALSWKTGPEIGKFFNLRFLNHFDSISIINSFPVFYHFILFSEFFVPKMFLKMHFFIWILSQVYFNANFYALMLFLLSSISFIFSQSEKKKNYVFYWYLTLKITKTLLYFSMYNLRMQYRREKWICVQSN